MSEQEFFEVCCKAESFHTLSGTEAKALINAGKSSMDKIEELENRLKVFVAAMQYLVLQYGSGKVTFRDEKLRDLWENRRLKIEYVGGNKTVFIVPKLDPLQGRQR